MIAPHLHRAAEGSQGRMTFDAIVKHVMAGDWHLFVVVAPTGRIEAVLCVNIWREVSGIKVCSVRFVVGEQPHKWVHLISELEDGARRAGCAKFEAWCRKGYAKYLPDYKLTHIQLEKDL